MWRYQMAVKGSEQELRWLKSAGTTRASTAAYQGELVSISKNGDAVSSL
ncbi:hypothetical protein IMAU10382_01567 [Lactiplantibacillus plantarum]|nr:hypothetical protein [Lactiplantibacillus plantarum]MCG0908586.1 hypothetical protein [Lactiplantibacillus plantarum]